MKPGGEWGRGFRVKVGQYKSIGMTEVTTDTTDRNDRPVAVGDIGNYAVSCANISQ